MIVGVKRCFALLCIAGTRLSHCDSFRTRSGGLTRSTSSRTPLHWPQSRRALPSGSTTCASWRWTSATATRTRRWPWAHLRSTTWTRASLLLGASAVKCPSTRSSPRHSGTSSTGRWPWHLIGSSSNGVHSGGYAGTVSVTFTDLGRHFCWAIFSIVTVTACYSLCMHI